MNTKKIEFTQEQYLELVQLVYLGRWMVSSHSDDPDTSLKDIEQSVYSNAKSFGLEHWVDFDPTFQKYFPSSQLEEDMEPVIQEYDNYTFWDELAWQLAERDFSRKFDESHILCMTEEEIFTEKSALSDKYFDEFLKNGLENFVISK
jgi:hypothetical protein